MNLAFIIKKINGVIYSRVELTSLGHLDFTKTLEGTDESVEDFLHMEDCQTIPNMNKDGWNQLANTLLKNESMRQAFQSVSSWIRIKGMISRKEKKEISV
jgi:hypothetical protein